MPLQALAPDQRAVVQLVLQRERSYAQIAELLSISEDAVRARAHAGLSALAPDVELPADKLGQVADFLLGQQNGKPRQATRRMLRSSNGAREWAETVRAQLVDVSGATVPELPAKAAAKAKEAPATEEKPAADEARLDGSRAIPRRERSGRAHAGRARSAPAPAPGQAAGPLGRRPDDRGLGSRRRGGGLLPSRRRGADRSRPARHRRRRAPAVRLQRRRRREDGRQRQGHAHADRRRRAAHPGRPDQPQRHRRCREGEGRVRALPAGPAAARLRAPGAGHAGDAEGLEVRALALRPRHPRQVDRRRPGRRQGRACSRSRDRARTTRPSRRTSASYRQILVTQNKGSGRKRPGTVLVRGNVPQA